MTSAQPSHRTRSAPSRSHRPQRRVSAGAGFLALILLGAAAPISDADARCHARFTSLTVMGSTLQRARGRAVQVWQGQVRGRIGQAWSHWASARGQHVDCRPRGNRWQCMASARPCRALRRHQPPSKWHKGPPIRPKF